MHKALVYGGIVAAVLAAAKLANIGPTAQWGWHIIIGAGVVVAVVCLLLK